MTRAQWIEEALRLADEVADLSGVADDICDHGCSGVVGDIEQAAEAARQQHAAARAALAAHLATDQP